jgi:hypothetical protein
MIMTTIAREQLKIQKMVKVIEQKIRDKIEKPEYDRSLVELSYQERLDRLERYMADHHILLDLLENQMKEGIREERVRKFQELSHNNYFSSQMRKNYWLMEQANMRNEFTSSYDLRRMEELFQKE